MEEEAESEVSWHRRPISRATFWLLGEVFLYLATSLTLPWWAYMAVLCLMWGLAAVMIIRSEWTINLHWSLKIGLCIFAAVVVWSLGSKTVLQAYNVNTSRSQTGERQPFNIEAGPGFVNLTQNLNNVNSGWFWAAYDSSYGKTASPIAVLLWLSITNMTDVPQRIQSYSVGIKTDECGWMQLSPIPVSTIQVYWTYEGLARAVLLDFRPNGLDYVLRSPIIAHDTAQGYWLFDSRIKCGPLNEGQDVQYRVDLETFSGISYEFKSKPSPINNHPQSGSEGAPSGPTLVKAPGWPVDISHYHRRLYSEPMN